MKSTIDDLNEGAENPDPNPVSKVTRVTSSGAPPPQMIDMATMKAFIEATVAAMGAKASNTDIAEAITQGLRDASPKIPENNESNGISVLNPLGDQKHPRPGFKCKMWFGVIDDSRPELRDRPRVTRTWEILPEDCTVWEQLALNMLMPVEGTVLRLDEIPMRVIVDGARHATSGVLERLVIALPLAIIGKKGENRNMVPNLTSVVYQLTGHDFRKETFPLPAKADDLAWFMAEHKAGRYVSKREAVAA